MITLRVSIESIYFHLSDDEITNDIQGDIP
jgi:hypothetical protein